MLNRGRIVAQFDRRRGDPRKANYDRRRAGGMSSQEAVAVAVAPPEPTGEEQPLPRRRELLRKFPESGALIIFLIVLSADFCPPVALLPGMAELAQHSPGGRHRGYRRRPRGGAHHLGQLRPLGRGRDRLLLGRFCRCAAVPRAGRCVRHQFRLRAGDRPIQRFRRHRARRQLPDRHPRQPRDPLGTGGSDHSGQRDPGQQLHSLGSGRPVLVDPHTRAHLDRGAGRLRRRCFATRSSDALSMPSAPIAQRLASPGSVCDAMS